MPPVPPRRHADVVARLQALDRARLFRAGPATDHDMWGVEVGTRPGAGLDVLLTAGVHGDEPAGVEAALRFLEAAVPPWFDRCAFTVVPCVNPSGFEAGTRVNAAGQDINRSMADDGVVESVTLRRLLDGRRFDLFVDLHEDYEATGFYMYEVRRAGPLLGPAIVGAVEPIGPVDGDDNTDEGKEVPLSKGVYAIQEKWRDQGWSAWAYYEGADHAVLTETPSTAWDLDRRVAAHLAALGVVLDHYTTERQP